MGSGPGASAWGEGEPSEAPRTFRTLRNSLLSLELAGPPVSPGLAFAPSVPARPSDPFSIPRSFLLRGSPGHPHRRVLSPACPRSAGRSPARELHASRVSLQPNAAPRPPPLGCGSAWLESRQGKFPAPGRPLVAAAAGGLLEPAACPRHRGLCREWESGISRLRVLRASGPQVVAGAFAASAARRAPCGPRGAPRVAGRLENLPGWRRLGERRAFPEDAERLAGASRVAAPVPGALARSRKKRAVFAFANKREPGALPHRRGRPRCARLPATSPLLLAAQRPRAAVPPAAASWRPAGPSGTGRWRAGV